MTTLYKLTDENGQTRGGTQWGTGVEHTARGDGGMCGPGWLHAYEHPLIAVLLNPIHADFTSPRLWLADGDVGLRDGVLKCGCTRLTTIEEIELPALTTEQRVEIAIWLASEVYDESSWATWAQRWLSGEDRSAAEAAAEAAWAAARAAAMAARAAARAAWAAWAAAEAEAAWAAWAAAEAEAEIDLIGIVEAVVGESMEKVKQ